MDETNPLSPSQITRYSRQLILSNGFGVAGQLTLLSSSCLVVGAGGLGSSALLYLAGAGVGEIGIVDNDVVELTNLHRQVIHDAKAVGVSKAANARRRIEDVNGDVKVRTYQCTLTHDNAEEIIRWARMCLDDATTRSRQSPCSCLHTLLV